MVDFVFPYSISFGKRDSVGDSLTVALSDANAKRLVRSAEEGGRNQLGEDEFISDICAKVYKALDKKLTEELLEDPTPVRDALSWDDSFDPAKAITKKHVQKYLDELMITAYYPEELQMLEPKASKKVTTAHYEIMDEAQAAEFIKKESYDSNVIVLTDEGKTLYHVPMKFSGTVTIPASVRKIRSGYSTGAFNQRVKIKEIIIENGLEEIDERAFSQCKLLKRIVIPSSVKKIGSFAFTGCTSLEEVRLSEGLEELENTAFNWCHKLTRLDLPSTLIEISKHINSYMDPISDLYFYGMNTKIQDRGGTWDRLTMHVLPGSEAEKYAIANKIKYVLMEDKQ